MSRSKAGYKPGDDVVLALDCAATEYFKDGAYKMVGEGKTCSSAENADYLADLCATLPDLLDRGRHGRGRFGTAGRR
jgi:enolase